MSEPAIAAIVLAAGRSTRMGAENKLLADISGKPMVRRVAEAALGSKARPVLVVIGHQENDVRAALVGLDVSLIPNPAYASGLSSSLKAGVRALPQKCWGALVLLGDMPRISSEHINRLIDAFIAENRMDIVAPTYQGKRGNPVLWPPAFFSELLQLEGDAGAKRLMTEYMQRVTDIDLETDAIFADVDTPEELRRLREGEAGD